MKLQRLAQIMLVSCGILALGGCTSTAKHNSMLASGGADQNGAEAAGIGEGDNFGDTGTVNGSHHAANKNTYYFDFDKSDVRSEDKPAILSKADQLVAQPQKKVILEGHTDPRGSREYNIGLGERRAQAVAAMLTAHGVNSSQIRVVSYGAEKLASPGRSEADYQLDRRVVLVYTKR